MEKNPPLLIINCNNVDNNKNKRPVRHLASTFALSYHDDIAINCKATKCQFRARARIHLFLFFIDDPAKIQSRWLADKDERESEVSIDNDSTLPSNLTLHRLLCVTGALLFNIAITVGGIDCRSRCVLICPSNFPPCCLILDTLSLTTCR